ncbi:hypothetical protein COCON_G00114860 [Conger conger]|uniref:Uncharacterized protein n=1 Tax=Conger conger TaxID=82655 RepID=A0A9Q1DFW5_CONCO|nr:hypothetical protein COCON_G00114860 [Conger conger]
MAGEAGDSDSKRGKPTFPLLMFTVPPDKIWSAGLRRSWIHGPLINGLLNSVFRVPEGCVFDAQAVYTARARRRHHRRQHTGSSRPDPQPWGEYGVGGYARRPLDGGDDGRFCLSGLRESRARLRDGEGG